MTIAGSIHTDKKPRTPRKSLAERLAKFDAATERLQAELRERLIKRGKMIDEAREAIRQKAEELENLR